MSDESKVQALADRHRVRIAELERRVLAGSDDREYCLRWINIHHRLLEALESK